jgi:hypothetical protein
MSLRSARLRAAIRYPACLVIAAASATVLAGCGSANRLSTQQIASQAWGLDSEQTQLGMIAPSSAFILGPRRDITLLSARLIPLKGYRLPQLVGVAVVQGCLNASSNYLVFPSWRWPPTVHLLGTRTLPVDPLPGDVVRTGGTRCIPLILYGVRSRAPGPYALAGLRIAFLVGHRPGSVAIYDQGLVAWFYALAPPDQGRFRRLFNAAVRVQNALVSG